MNKILNFVGPLLVYQLFWRAEEGTRIRNDPRPLSDDLCGVYQVL